VFADLPDRDAVQPGPGAGYSRIESAAGTKRGQERLGCHILREIRAKPRMHVPQDLAGMPVEDRGEQLRVDERLPNQLRVADICV